MHCDGRMSYIVWKISSAKDVLVLGYELLEKS